MTGAKKGRPSKYTTKLADEICERLAAGESLNGISKDEHIPHRVNIMRWLLNTENKGFDLFRTKYALAREIQYQNMADELLDISDNDVSQPLLIEGRPVLDEKGFAIMVKDNVGVQHARLRVDTRKWFMSKVLPKFSDKTDPSQAPSETLADSISKLIDKLPN
tara:strand:+ start:40 stop:528 length:489 start_codon:yes stop_codon:yes gene_type:complete